MVAAVSQIPLHSGVMLVSSITFGAPESWLLHKAKCPQSALSVRIDGPGLETVSNASTGTLCVQEDQQRETPAVDSLHWVSPNCILVCSSLGAQADQAHLAMLR